MRIPYNKKYLLSGIEKSDDKHLLADALVDLAVGFYRLDKPTYEERRFFKEVYLALVKKLNELSCWTD